MTRPTLAAFRCLLFVLLLAPSSVRAQESPFLQFPPDPEPRNASWSPRGGHTITVVDDAMILIGGWDAVTLWNDVLQWQYAGEGWTSLGSPSFSPRFGHSTIWFDSKTLLVIAGAGQDFVATGPVGKNDVHASQDGGKTWTVLTTAAEFSPRYVTSVTQLNSVLYLAGGYPGVPDGVLMDLWTSTDGATWTEVVPTSRSNPVPRYAFTIGTIAGTIWLIGGLTTERQSSVLNDVWTFDPLTSAWTQHDSYPATDATRNIFGRGIEHNGGLLIIGGWSTPQEIASPADQGLFFDGSSFTRFAIAPLHPIAFAALASFRGSVLVQGGENFEGVFWNEVFVSNGDYAIARPPPPLSSTGGGETGVESSTGGGTVVDPPASSTGDISSTGAIIVVPPSSTGGSSNNGGASSTAASSAGASSTGKPGGVIVIPSGTSSSTGRASSSTGAQGGIDDLLQVGSVSTSSSSSPTGALPVWGLVLCVILGVFALVVCGWFIFLATLKRKRKSVEEIERKNKIDAALAEADLEAAKHKQAPATVAPLAADKEKARAEKEMRKQTFGGAAVAAGALAGGGIIAAGGSSKEKESHKNGYDALTEKESLISRGEPRSSIVGPASVTGIHAGHQERSSISTASSSSASSTPTVSRKNSFVAGGAAAAPAAAATTPASTSAASQGPQPQSAAFFSPPPSSSRLPLAAAGGAVAGAGVASAVPKHHTPSPPLTQARSPQPTAVAPAPAVRRAPSIVTRPSPPPRPVAGPSAPVVSPAQTSPAAHMLPPPAPLTLPASAAAAIATPILVPPPSAAAANVISAPADAQPITEWTYTYDVDEDE